MTTEGREGLWQKPSFVETFGQDNESALVPAVRLDLRNR